jgi:alcohol dehydrogenase (NADP+)
MSTVTAYGAPSASQPLEPMRIERRELGPHDVNIQIRYTGICHSDIHHARSDWRHEPYPLVPGHEIAGVITEVGEKVTRHAVGDRVGVGCVVRSCRECANCRAGREQYCIPGNTLTYGSADRDGSITQGGYSTHIVVDEHFVLSIPDGIGLDEAAPLLCACITTYSPLRRHGAGPGKNVAVVGPSSCWRAASAWWAPSARWMPSRTSPTPTPIPSAPKCSMSVTPPRCAPSSSAPPPSWGGST